VVLRAGEHLRKLQPLETRMRLADGRLGLGAGDLVAGLVCQLPQRDRVFDLARLAGERAELLLEAALLLAQRLRLLLVVPEAGLDALPLDQIDARLLAIDVKAPPAARRGAG
jgi:hypothetical protein